MYKLYSSPPHYTIVLFFFHLFPFKGLTFEAHWYEGRCLNLPLICRRERQAWTPGDRWAQAQVTRPR